jgi:hypothetical protein
MRYCRIEMPAIFMIPRSFLFILIAWFLGHQAEAQETFFNHIRTLSPEKITISCEWDSMLAVKDDNSWDAVVVLSGPGFREEWKAGITPRGKFRRSRCAFPPLEINLKKRQLREEDMLEFDKLKVVTHCTMDDAKPEDLYEELLIYRMYNVLTPQSFKAVDVVIDYVYPNGKVFQKNAAALILEPTSELAYRTGGRELEGYSVPPDSLDPESYCRSAMFQFMVGNSDWNQTLQRNIKMVGEPASYHVIPYDFDFSAIVSPPYAMITKDHGLQDFKDRVYLGAFFAEGMPAMIREFCDKKTALYKCVNDFELLSKSRRKQIIKYLDDFYTYVEAPGQAVTYGTILRYQKKVD